MLRIDEITEAQAAVKDACLDTLQKLLPDTRLIYLPSPSAETNAPNRQDDGQLSMSGPWGEENFVLEIKKDITRTGISSLIHQLKHADHSANQPSLLMTSYVAQPAAMALRDARINFVDAAGNMNLDLLRLRIWQTGNKRQTPPERPSRLFQSVGLKLLSVLLEHPQHINATYRELADRAGIALGNVGHLLDELAGRNFLAGDKTHRTLQRPAELLDQWALGWANQLLPRLLVRTCRSIESPTLEPLSDRLGKISDPGQLLIGGEFAAMLAAGYLRPARATLHIHRASLGKWLQQLRLIPDPNGNIDLVDRFGKQDEWASPPHPSTNPLALHGIKLVNPVLIYGELLRQGHDDRLRETAQRLMNDFILPRFG